MRVSMLVSAVRGFVVRDRLVLVAFRRFLPLVFPLVLACLPEVVASTSVVVGGGGGGVRCRDLRRLRRRVERASRVSLFFSVIL